MTKQLREVVEKPPIKEGLGAHIKRNRDAYIGTAIGSIAGPAGAGFGTAVGMSLDKGRFKKEIQSGKYKTDDEKSANAPAGARLGRAYKGVSWDKWAGKSDTPDKKKPATKFQWHALNPFVDAKIPK